MTKKKTETTTNQQQSATQANTYGYMTAPETADVTETRNIAQSLRGKVDPSIRATYAGARNDLEDSFLNPLGAYTTPAVRDATLREGKADLAQHEAAALNQADFQSGQTDLANQAMVAGMTAPQMVQTGGSSTGSMSGKQTQIQSEPFLNTLLQVGGQVGSAALM